MDFRVDVDNISGRWAVYQRTEFGKVYPLNAVRWDTQEQAESFLDRVIAIMDGEPESVLADLRTDSDRLRTRR
jgi:hypothetical protein